MNPQPSRLERAALPVELQHHGAGGRLETSRAASHRAPACPSGHGNLPKRERKVRAQTLRVPSRSERDRRGLITDVRLTDTDMRDTPAVGFADQIEQCALVRNTHDDEEVALQQPPTDGDGLCVEEGKSGVNRLRRLQTWREVVAHHDVEAVFVYLHGEHRTRSPRSVK